MQLTTQKKYKLLRRKPVHTINNEKACEIPQYTIYVKYTSLYSYTKPGNGPFELKNCGSLLTVHCYVLKIDEFEGGFSVIVQLKLHLCKEVTCYKV
jgi:hypothetical protein